MGRSIRLREAVEDGHDLDDDIRAGGKPSVSTPADKRLKENKGNVSAPGGKKPKTTPAKVTHGF
jgi:hypothetical protein